MAYRKMVCTYGRPLCDGCPVQSSCPYPSLFETPQATGEQRVQRMRDIPHPIVIEPPLQHRESYQPGDPLEFAMVFLGGGIRHLPEIVFATKEMVSHGLGSDRARFRLKEIRDSQDHCLYANETGSLSPLPAPITVGNLVSASEIITPLRMILETPLRLKVDGDIAGRGLSPTEVLKAACRRLWGLLVWHERVPREEVDFRPLLAPDRVPKLRTSNLHWRKLTRYSNRQQAKIRLDGLEGELVMEENLEIWWPVLLAVQQVHIGKSAVMGLGKVRLESDAKCVRHATPVSGSGPQ